MWSFAPRLRPLLVAVIAVVMPRVSGQMTGQPSTKRGEWPMYTADLAGSTYSPLDQVNATDVSTGSRLALQIAPSLAAG